MLSGRMTLQIAQMIPHYNQEITCQGLVAGLCNRSLARAGTTTTRLCQEWKAPNEPLNWLRRDISTTPF